MKSQNRLLIEDDDDDQQSWLEYLEDEGLLEASALDEFVATHNLSRNYPVRDNKNVIVLSDGKDTAYLISDGEDYEYIDDIEDWAQNLTENEFTRIFKFTVEDLYNPYLEGTLKDCQEFPPTVYHYTTEEKWDEIQESGVLNTTYGTGITNRNSRGVFCSVDWETNQLGSYGDVCLAIDLAKLKDVLKLSELNLSYEPEVEEYLLADFISSVMDLNIYNEISSSGGMSLDTIIVNHRIPISCVSVFEGNWLFFDTIDTLPIKNVF